MAPIQMVKITPVEVNEIAAEAYYIREQEMVWLSCMFDLLIS